MLSLTQDATGSRTASGLGVTLSTAPGAVDIFTYIWNGTSWILTSKSLARAVSVAEGGTGATNATAARTNLGLGNVDNTPDVDKPVSTATQTALDLKAPLASPTFTGTVNVATITSSGVVSGTNLRGSSTTASTPALSFTGDTDTGFYSVFGNEVGVVTGASFKTAIRSTDIRMTSGNLLAWATSSATLVSSTLDTGIARPSAGNVSVTNGSATTYLTLGAGGIQFTTDNSVDIGASAATRPRNIFVGSSVVIKTKAGIPTDADVTNPTDGMQVVDTTNHRLYIRSGGVWKYTVLA